MFRSLVIAALVLFSTIRTVAATSGYIVVDIGPCPRIADDVSPALNDNDSVSYWITDGNSTRAAVWQAGKTVDLGAPKGFRSSIASDINDHGDVAGWAVTTDNPVDSSATKHAFRRHAAGKPIDIGTLGGPDSQAFAIDNAGDIVGTSIDKSGNLHAFVYTHGRIHDLGTLPGGSFSTANAIANTNLIVGQADDSTQHEHAVIWENGKIRDLGILPGGTRSRAIGLNDRGDIVGFSEVEHADVHAFGYLDGKMIDLGTLGDEPSRADAIDDHDDVVGSSGVREYVRHAFLWNDGKMTDLNILIPAASGWHLDEAYAINAHGHILCTGTRPGSDRHLLLLLPK